MPQNSIFYIKLFDSNLAKFRSPPKITTNRLFAQIWPNYKCGDRCMICFRHHPLHPASSRRHFGSLGQPYRIIPLPRSQYETHVLHQWFLDTNANNCPQYLSLEPIPKLVSFVKPETASASTRSKAVYALSGLLKLNAAAVRALGDEGWATLRVALEGLSVQYTQVNLRSQNFSQTQT